jgi:hypothetical protein
MPGRWSNWCCQHQNQTYQGRAGCVKMFREQFDPAPACRVFFLVLGALETKHSALDMFRVYLVVGLLEARMRSSRIAVVPDTCVVHHLFGPYFFDLIFHLMTGQQRLAPPKYFIT